MLQETGATASDEAATLKAYRISFVFLFSNVHTQKRCYKEKK